MTSTTLHAGAIVTELVPGSPGDLDRLVARCRTVANGLGGAATRVRAIDSGEWVGPAGDAFREVVDIEPGTYDDAAAAFGATATAVHAYVDVLRDAQADARTAITLYEHAQSQTKAWQARQDQYATDVRTARAEAEDPAAAAKAVDGLARPSSYDPGTDDRERAATLLSDARERVRAAGSTASRRIAAAWEHAPREPHWWEKAGHFVAEIGRGAWEATTGLVEFAWSISPTRMMVDPDGWRKDVTDLGKGLWFGVQHPAELGKALIDWDTWKESPGRAIGHLVPDLLLALGTAGAGTVAARSVRGMKALDEVADVATTFRRLDRLGEGPQRLTYLQRARNFLSGERLPAPNLPDTPAGLAKAWQSHPNYPNPDNWFNARLETGDEIAFGSLSFKSEVAPGNFVVPRSVLDGVGTDAVSYNEGLQIRPFHGSYRDETTIVRVEQPMDVAVAYTKANPQYGPGGLRQIFIPDDALSPSAFTQLERRAMTNLEARILVGAE
jgi:hypothetical protein